MKKSFTDKYSVYEYYEFTYTIFSDIFNLYNLTRHTTKQLHGLKITEGLEGGEDERRC